MKKTHDILEEQALRGEPLSCRIIDAHAHIGTGSYFPLYANTPESFLASMDRIGCAKCFISHYAGLINHTDLALEEMKEVVKAAPGRLYGYITADAGYACDIERQLQAGFDAGFRAVKIHVSSSAIPYNHPNYDKIYAFADKHAFPMLIHTWGTELKDLEGQYEKYPRINFILGHAGSSMPEEYVRHAKRYNNVYLESCFSASTKGLIEYFVREGMADKLLWGSDMNFYSNEHQLGRVVFADISLEDKYKILGKNAAKVLLKEEVKE